MLRKISEKTWDDAKEEMSIASDRDKFIKLGKEIIDRISLRIDHNHIPDIINAQVMTERILAHLYSWERIARSKTNKAMDAILKK